MKFSRQKMLHLKWLRRKELIRINCFIMIAILLMVLLFMGFPIVSNAEGFSYDDTLPSHFGISESDILIQSNIQDTNGYFYSLLSDSYSVYFDNDLTNGAILWDSAIDSFTYTVGSSTYSPNSAVCYRGYFSSSNAFVLEFYFMPCEYRTFKESANANIIPMFCTSIDSNSTGSNNTGWELPQDNVMIRCYFVKDSDNIFRLQQYNPIVGFTAFSSSNRYINGDICRYGTYGSSIILGNIDCIALPDDRFYKRASYQDSNDNWVTEWLFVPGEQYNPNSSNSNSSSIQNHLKPYEGSCVYMQYSNLNTGNMHIVVKSDEFQKTENASIKLKCSVSAQTQYNSSVGLQESNVGVDGPFQNNFSSPNESFNNGPYVEYEIPLSYFNNSGDYTISLEDINKGLWNTNEKTLYSFNSCFQNNSTGLATAFKTFFFSILSTQNIIPDYSNMPNFLYSLNSEVWDVQGVFCIGENEEIFDSFQLDMISGDIENQDYDLPNEDDVKEVLDTPTVPNNYVPQPYKPSYPDAYNVTVPNNNTDVNNDNSNSNESNDNITVSGGENSVNVVTNINQGNKYPEKGVMRSFVRIINNDKNNTVNDIDTMIGGSSYIQLMNNALVAVPDQVWSIWITALKAILGIAVSAFFLKILINWAT